MSDVPGTMRNTARKAPGELGGIQSDAVFIRRQAGKWENGNWIPGQEVPTPVNVVFKPGGDRRDETGRIGREQVVGVRVDGSALVVVTFLSDYAALEPSAGREDTGPDLIKHRGNTWQVHRVLNWDDSSKTAELFVVRYRDEGSWTPPAGSITPSSAQVQRWVEEIAAEGSLVPRERVLSAYQTATLEVATGTRAFVTRISEANLTIADTNHRSQTEDQYTLDSVTFATVRSFWDMTWVGPGALDSCQRFRLWVRSPAGFSFARDRALVFSRVGVARVRTDLVQDTWEERAGLDIGFHYVQSFRFTTPAMARFPVSIRLQTESDTVIIEEETIDGTQPRP